MTRYSRLIDEKIVGELKKGTRTASNFYALLNKSIPGISWTTVFKHLTKLCNAGIIQKSCIPGANNKRSYSLSDSTKFYLKKGNLDLVEEVEVTRGDPTRREENQEKRNRKIQTLLLFQLATCSSRWKVLRFQTPKQ